MKIVVQRVSRASVIVRDETIGSIKKGLLLLVGIDKNDTEQTVQQMTEKILKFRIFGDDEHKMNHSVLDVNGEVLLVPNFTLSANNWNGNRPSFAGAAAPDKAEELFDMMCSQFRLKIETQVGEFGAHMGVKLINDGPVTFNLESE